MNRKLCRTKLIFSSFILAGIYSIWMCIMITLYTTKPESIQVVTTSVDILRTVTDVTYLYQGQIMDLSSSNNRSFVSTAVDRNQTELHFTHTDGDTTTSNGYMLASYVSKRCPVQQLRGMVSLHAKFSIQQSLELCPVWKVGSTLLRRLFMLKNFEKYKSYTNPYAISFLEEYREKLSSISNTGNKTRAMFVRNPYNRVFSVYVDKLLAPNPYYWKVIGAPAISYTSMRDNPSKLSLKCGHDVTFTEFIQYVSMVLGVTNLNKSTRRRSTYIRPDPHFETITKLCKPCDVKYNFVGKLETFGQDLKEFMKFMDLPETENLLRSNGSFLANEDAIKDTINQAFDPDFQAGFKRCNISRTYAIQRAWLKLQVRGLIGRQNLTIADEKVEQLSYTHCVQLAMDAYRNSSKQERQMMKRDYFRSYYLNVDSQIRDTLKKAYADDFRIFGYDNLLELS